MNSKRIKIFLLLMTICLLILGGMFKFRAEEHKGLSVQVGYMVDGEFRQTNSGNIAGNPQAVKEYNLVANLFFFFSGLSGILCIVAFIDDAKSQRRN